jgi:hypothetical protein
MPMPGNQTVDIDGPRRGGLLMLGPRRGQLGVDIGSLDVNEVERL